METSFTITEEAVQPEEVVQPEEADDTENSAEEATEDTAQNPDTDESKEDESPKTGDENPLIWMLVLVLGSGTALYLASKRKQ